MRDNRTIAGGGSLLLQNGVYTDSSGSVVRVANAELYGRQGSSRDCWSDVNSLACWDRKGYWIWPDVQNPRDLVKFVST